MATVIIQQPLVRQSPTPPPQSPSLTLNASNYSNAPIPNNRLPYCSPGPVPVAQYSTPVTPPASPPTTRATLLRPSILHPAHRYPKISEVPPVYVIGPSTLAAAVDNLATTPFPDPKHVFPWLHGLHPDNQPQLEFFVARRKVLRTTPKCIRGIAIVKAGGDLTKSKLKGALDIGEILSPDLGDGGTFLEIDPQDGFSIRNFHIQIAKMARMSDVVVYGDGNATEAHIYKVAQRIANAQRSWHGSSKLGERDVPIYNTFVVASPFSEFERNHPELVAIDSQGQSTGRVMDLFQWEKREMYEMSKASEIARNVWLGPTPESLLWCPPGSQQRPSFDILIEANDLAQTPDLYTLEQTGEKSYSAPQHLEFPSSGSILPPSWLSSTVDPLTQTCSWIYRLANPSAAPDEDEDEPDADGDIPMKELSPNPRKILIYCTDGYTESTLLALAYLMYAEAIPLHDAWLRLHREKNRNFFAYPTDVALLTSLQPRLLGLSPQARHSTLSALPAAPAWLSRVDGSLPSRILPYMYLGNLLHANNPDLLRAMGITRVLSVGEPVGWRKTQLGRWGLRNLYFVDRIQDNGVDPLIGEIEGCLEFIERGRKEGTTTLVHCRVGVSRSATICIAEVMASLGLSFPRAYCFVRARRLNVIIQPHLRFVYELLKWDEFLQRRRGEPIRHDLEWATIAGEIAAMNRPYSR